LETLRQRDGELDAAERHHAYDVMYREEQRLERVVQQLLQASSLEEPAARIVIAQLDWAKAVREQVECMQREAPDREFSITMAENLPPVIGDDQMAAQVLANLLSNAVRFSPDETPVEVDVQYARERMFTTITDQGPGIPDEDRDRIFEKFTRLDDHGGQAEQGVGLGLYIVRRSIQAMGGTIWVDDGPAGGSTFAFSLPASPVRAKRSGARTR
jgi:two-component system sensor histidine kinase KdpD